MLCQIFVHFFFEMFVFLLLNLCKGVKLGVSVQTCLMTGGRVILPVGSLVISPQRDRPAPTVRQGGVQGGVLARAQPELSLGGV